MFTITKTTSELLITLGQRLRQARLVQNESQQIFAERLGISRQSYSKMENGAPTTPIGYWLKASELFGMLDSWSLLLTPKENLFNQQAQKKALRKRAGSAKTGKK